MKVYLIGFLYEDFDSEGFETVQIASTIEKAKAIVHFLTAENSKYDYEIREWEVDTVNPIGDINKHQCYYGKEYFDVYTTYPYKVISFEDGDLSD